jgi:hypothetical protein
LAQLLRQVHHLDDASRRQLADLVDELAAALHGDAPPEHAAHLAGTAADLVRALQGPEDALLPRARSRFEDAATRAEVEAPVATGVARQIVDLLAELGI